MIDYKQLLIDKGIPSNIIIFAGEDAEGVPGATFTRSLSESEQLLSDSVLSPEVASKKQALIDAANLGNWWTWTQVQFDTWANTNLLSNTAVDAATLAQLKDNIKALNLLGRNMAKLLMAIRDVIKFIVKRI